MLAIPSPGVALKGNLFKTIKKFFYDDAAGRAESETAVLLAAPNGVTGDSGDRVGSSQAAVQQFASNKQSVVKKSVLC